MEYIIASIGRSGSTLITELIEKSTKKEKVYVYDIKDKNGYIKKTHAHFKEDPNFDYKAIYLYGNIGSSIHSMYLKRVKYSLHLDHLEVSKKHINNFLILLRLSRLLAFLYLIKNDKFRFKDNYKSWKKSKNTLFIKYENLCSNKEDNVKKIEDFLGLKLPSFEILPRKSSAEKLPSFLKRAINKEYGNYFDA